MSRLVSISFRSSLKIVGDLRDLIARDLPFDAGVVVAVDFRLDGVADLTALRERRLDKQFVVGKPTDRARRQAVREVDARREEVLSLNGLVDVVLA